jgi:hypothetical protein
MMDEVHLAYPVLISRESDAAVCSRDLSTTIPHSNYPPSFDEKGPSPEKPGWAPEAYVPQEAVLYTGLRFVG